MLICAAEIRGHDIDRDIDHDIGRVSRNHEGQTMTRSATHPLPSKAEQVAGNGLLHRRALLRRGAAFASALSAGVGLNATGAAADAM